MNQVELISNELKQRLIESNKNGFNDRVLNFLDSTFKDSPDICTFIVLENIDNVHPKDILEIIKYTNLNRSEKLKTVEGRLTSLLNKIESEYLSDAYIRVFDVGFSAPSKNDFKEEEKCLSEFLHLMGAMAEISRAHVSKNVIHVMHKLLYSYSSMERRLLNGMVSVCIDTNDWYVRTFIKECTKLIKRPRLGDRWRGALGISMVANELLLAEKEELLSIYGNYTESEIASIDLRISVEGDKPLKPFIDIWRVEVFEQKITDSVSSIAGDKANRNKDLKI